MFYTVFYVFFLEMCLVAINALERHGQITKDENCSIKSTNYGRLMARYYICFETMKLFRQVNGNEHISDILKMLTNCAEFFDFKLRANDKRALNELNRGRNHENVRFQIKGRITTVPSKISCLIQAILGNLPIIDSSLHQEAIKIMQLAERLIKCLFECIQIAEKSEKSGYFSALWSVAVMSKCLESKLWENSPYVSKQLRRIGTQYASSLAKMGLQTIDSIVKCDPRQIEMVRLVSLNFFFDV